MKPFYLTIVTPSSVYFEGEVSSLTAPGGAGSFGVLADHAPIISTLSQGTLTFSLATQKNEKRAYQIGPGFIDVLKNRVTVVTNGVQDVT
jgi:F-type H+-transporting ATPase subunit epsilon